MTVNIIAILAIIIGLILSYYGYRVQKFLIIVACFGFGYTLAGELLGSLIADGKILILVQALVGFIVALLGLKVEKLAVFLGVTYLAYSAVGAYLPAISSDIVRIIVQLGVAIVIGALAMMFMKEIIIIASAIFGAGLIQDYLPKLIPSIPTLALTVITILIAVTGIIFQFKNN